jgi:hypothetical protein
MLFVPKEGANIPKERLIIERLSRNCPEGA